MAHFPRDRYDDIPDDHERVGAHRAPVRAGRGWIRFAWAALATGLLVVGGLFALSRINPAIQFDIPLPGGGASPQATDGGVPGVEPVTDPALVDPALLETLSISVFNGSPNNGVQEDAVLQIASAGWPEPTGANASVRDEEATVIYFRSAEYEGIAKGMAQILGVGTTVLSDAYPGAPVTIVLGGDYLPPQG